MTIAVIMTCHNRRQKTLNCLAALFNQLLVKEVRLCVYLVDDGSTDGTAAAVRETYPQVKILQGDGSLFWNGGMRLAFAEAVKHGYDYYLWLNDDTVLYPEALGTLLATSRRLAEKGYIRTLVTGSTCDPETGVLTYGGVVRSIWYRPLRFHLVEPDEEEKLCDTMNGNCVLIPQEVVGIVGNLDPAFNHDLGDYDYGLRAQQQECKVFVAPGYIGTCSPNPPQNRMTDLRGSLGNLWKKVDQPKGLPLKDVNLHSFKEWKVFAQRYGGLLWSIYWLLPYSRLFLLSVFWQPKRQ